MIPLGSKHASEESRMQEYEFETLLRNHILWYSITVIMNLLPAVYVATLQAALWWLKIENIYSNYNFYIIFVLSAGKLKCATGVVWNVNQRILELRVA